MKEPLTKDIIKKAKMVVRLPNWIGDTLMTFPMLLALQKSNIDFICIGHPWAESLFSGTDIKIVVNNNVRSLKWCYQFYKSHDFKFGLLCPKTFSAVLPMRFAGIKTFGYHFLSHKRFKYNYDSHTVENYFDLAKGFLNNPFIKTSEFSSTIPVNEKTIKLGEKIIDQNISEKYIVICPYATNLHKGKNKEWPFWKEFCGKYKKTKIVALVSSNDYEKCKEDFPEIIVLTNELSISGYIMRKANFVLANDSGAMHLASFFGAKIIGLFGATEINKTKPWYGSYKIGDKSNFISVEDLLQDLKKYN